MAKIQTSNYIMCNILVQLILLVVVKAASLSSNFTDDNSQFERSHLLKRVARSSPSSRIDMTIIDAGEEIKIQWEAVNRFLVNKNLPVYLARRNSEQQPIHVKRSMAQFGNVIQYHDTKKRASAVYFLNHNELVGEIGSTYTFRIPYANLSKPLEVGSKKYVQRQSHRDHGIRKCSMDYERVSVPLSSAQHNVKQREIDSKQLNISHIQVRRDAGSTVENSYIETLLFIPYDIAERFHPQTSQYAHFNIAYYYIPFFNIIDMIFSNIGSNEIQLFVNLAGIIIEGEDGIFSEIINNPQLKYRGDGLLDIGFLLDDFQEYPKHPSFPFERNSFDIMMILTGRELQLGLGSVFGWHRDVPDIFENMMDGQVDEVPTVIARKYEKISSACFAAREIGKVLGIKKNDDLSSETNEDGDECFGMMQPSNYYCSECFKWNYQSVTQLELFMSQNSNRCFLLNYPRSLDPPNTRRKSLTPQRQCECYGYCRTNRITLDDSESMLPSQKCRLPLACKSTDSDGQTIDELTILPLEGTPCGGTNVCWNGQCVPLSGKQGGPNTENNETS